MPQLNASASLALYAQTISVPRVLSFCCWLRTHSVQQLSLELRGIEAAAAAEVAPALGAALGACGAGFLTVARLCLPRDLLGRLSSWVAALRGLRKLKLSSADGKWYVSRSLARLSQLEVLCLDRVDLAATALPSSLTGLQLFHDYSWDMPQQVWLSFEVGCCHGWRTQPSTHSSPSCPLPCCQVSTLTRLQAVSLCEVCFSNESMELLDRLPRLRSAAFCNCEMLPECLCRLTGLVQLCLEDQAVYASNVNALLHLSQLTCLVLLRAIDEDTALAAALPRMPQLRALSWCAYGSHLPAGGFPVLPVPGGPWLGSLLRLEADPGDLPAVLPSATSLQELSLDASIVVGDDVMQQVADVARCAAAVPQLCRLTVCTQPFGPPPPPVVLTALAGSRACLEWIETDTPHNSAPVLRVRRLCVHVPVQLSCFLCSSAKPRNACAEYSTIGERYSQATPARTPSSADASVRCPD